MTLHLSKRLFLSAFLLSILLFLSPGGCKRGDVKAVSTPTVTNENLQTAYAKATKYKRMYTLFVKQAEKEHNKAVADLFRAVAHSEDIRANNHAKLLRERGIEPVTPAEEAVAVGTTAQTLKMALSSEEIQFDDMYPNMIRTAEIEKDSVGERQFTMAKAVDERHRELFFEAINARGKNPGIQYFTCSGCGYVFTSDKDEECPVCRMKKASFEKV